MTPFARSWLVLGLSVAALAPGTAFAQSQHTPAAKPLAESLPEGANQAYAYGQTLFRNGDYAGAVAKYRQAYDLSKDPRLLFNMALCERSLHAYARTQDLLLRYIREAGSSLSSADRAEADGALAAVRSLVGTVALSVNEEGATVAVDGEAVGTTPLAAPLSINLGAHKLGVSKPGFVPFEQAVSIAGGAATTVTVTLSAHSQGGHLALNAEPEATVALDGQVVGAGHFDGPVAAGVHALRVTEPGKKPYAVDLELHDGETRTVDVTLEPEAREGAPLWPWVTGGVVLAAGLAVGGYFLFKPQDATGPSAPHPANALGSFQLTAWGR